MLKNLRHYSSTVSFNFLPFVSGKIRQNKTAKNGNTAKIDVAIHRGFKLATNGATIAPSFDPAELKLNPMFLIGVEYNSITSKYTTAKTTVAASPPKPPTMVEAKVPSGMKMRAIMETPMVTKEPMAECLRPKYLATTIAMGDPGVWKINKTAMH